MFLHHPDTAKPFTEGRDTHVIRSTFKLQTLPNWILMELPWLPWVLDKVVDVSTDFPARRNSLGLAKSDRRIASVQSGGPASTLTTAMILKPNMKLVEAWHIRNGFVHIVRTVHLRWHTSFKERAKLLKSWLPQTEHIFHIFPGAKGVWLEVECLSLDDCPKNFNCL